MFVLVAYDVQDDRRRLHVASEMENFGSRVQRSVFECHLDRRQLAELKRRVKLLIDPDEDRVKGYRLCRKDQGGVVIDGQGKVSRDNDYFVI